MLNFTHELFGNNRPELSGHFFQRYAERIFNVSEQNSECWARTNFNRIRIVKDFYDRLKKSVLIKNENILQHYREKYGKDIQFLRHNRYIFVVRNYKTVVTIFKAE